MKAIWHWITSREPAASAEAVRQVLLGLVLAGLVSLTDQQLAGYMMVVSALLSWFVRSEVTPTE